MIFYFSGTGNSRFIAEQLGEKLNTEIVSINEVLKNNIKKDYNDTKPFVFIAPIYAGTFPTVVIDFIRNTNFTGNEKVYCVATCGGDSTGTTVFMESLLKEKELRLQGFMDIKMPANYVILYNTKSKEVNETTIKNALPLVEQLASKIDKEEYFSLNRKIGALNKFRGSEKMANFFNKRFAKDDGFKTTDKCNGCGACEKECSLNNIKMVENKPTWNGNCIHCVACISVCPQKAIEFKNKTQNRNRHYLKANSKF